MKFLSIFKKIFFVIFAYITLVNSAASPGCGKTAGNTALQTVMTLLAECQQGKYNLLCQRPARSEIPCKCDYSPCYRYLNQVLSCTPGRSYVASDPSGTYAFRRWETLDAYDGSANKCGVEYYKYSGSDPSVFETGCSNPDHKMIRVDNSLLGYDAYSNNPPVGITSLSPAINTVIYDNDPISINFDNTVKADSISFGGDMGSTVHPNFRFSRSTEFNDTLNLGPNGSWPLGKLKTLALSYMDVNDKANNPVITYHIISSGTSKNPSFNTCVNPCKRSWQESYNIQLNVSGGVPPYKWYSTASLPAGISLDLPPEYSASLPPGANISEQGVLSGPPTNNFYGIYYFGIVVIDSIGQTFPEIITLDTTDIGAQIAACYLLGICG
jgi:hypothetical protein